MGEGKIGFKTNMAPQRAAASLTNKAPPLWCDGAFLQFSDANLSG